MSFIRHSDEMTVENKQMFGGIGELSIHKILNGPEEMFAKGRLFNHMYIEPGNMLGWHIHNGDCETYYILKGKGEYSDNGKLITVVPGDTLFVNSGEGHSIKNIGDEMLEFIALVLYV